MRLFIGIDLPSDIKVAITKALAPMHTAIKGWEASHDYHQTLLFIGETDDANVEMLKTRLDKILFSPFSLQIKGFSFFSRRIMYVDFFYSEDLIRLKRLVDLEFPEYIRPDEKSFVPHVTVKRWQRYEYDQLAEGIAGQDLPQLNFEVHSLCLFKSARDQNNFKYHVIHESQFPRL